MNFTKKVKHARILLLANLDINQDDLMADLNLNKNELINVLLELCDRELYQFANPLANDYQLDVETLEKLKYYFKEVDKVLGDEKFIIKNREVVISALNIVKKMISNDLNETEEISYSNVIENLIFDTNNIGIFKIVYNKYKKEFKQHFRDSNNYKVLIEKLFEKIADGKNEYYLISVVKILSLIAVENSTKHNDMLHLINNYNSKMKSKKNKNNRRDIKKYIGMLKKSVEKHSMSNQEILNGLNINYGIDREFDAEVLNEIRNLRRGIIDGCYDLTTKKVVTIDTKSSGCWEDGLSLEKLENGNYLLGLYVIDPSAYFFNNCLLEKEAEKRTQTIYLKDDVIPMFPKELYYELFSLKKGERRKVIAHLYEFSKSFDLINFETKKAIIKVVNNYYYDDLENVNSVAEERLVEQLQKLRSVLEVQYPQVGKFYEEKSNFVENAVSHIKVFSNHTITTEYQKTNHPFIYCVNEDVNRDVNHLQINNPELDLHDMVNKTKTYYSLDNKGHCGLELDCYAKVTTPVRNFAAYRNQNLFKDIVIDGKRYQNIELYYLESDLKELVEYMNNKKEMIDAYTDENNYYAKKIRRYSR